MSGSDITPCIKIDKLLVVYIFKNISWALTRQNLSSGFQQVFLRVSNQSLQLQKLARKFKISPVASLHMILSKKRITKALIGLLGCAGWSAPVFSRIEAYS